MIRKRNGKYKALSLLEVMVVVAIISVLSVLLFPSVQRTLERAGSAQCLANLRQIGAGAGLYATEHGVFPYHISGNTRWFEGSADPNSFFAGPYLKSHPRSQRSTPDPTVSARKGLFDCPVMTAEDKLGLGPEEWTRDDFDYAQNLSLCGRSPGSIARPSQTILFAEGGHYARVKAQFTKGLTYTPAADSNPGGTAWNFSPRSPLVYVHGSRANFLFADGHVAAHEHSELHENWFDGKD